MKMWQWVGLIVVVGTVGTMLAGKAAVDAVVQHDKDTQKSMDAEVKADMKLPLTGLSGCETGMK
jgi:hypothetical protein